MNSESYQTEGTLGQSSPLLDSSDPPYSSSYALFPGFWYTTEASSIFGCLWDKEPAYPDGDIDGLDLAVFADVFTGDDPAIFALDFGLADCWE